MLDAAHLITFAAMSFAIIVAPGPSVLFVIGRGVALGRRAALATVVGNAAGAYVLVLLIAAGLGPLLERSERLLVAVNWPAPPTCCGSATRRSATGAG